MAVELRAPALRGPARTSWVSGVFAVCLFLSAGLLFLVQPLLGKLILPKFGGAPAVWNTCLVFFQAALLAGYTYAHASTAWLGVRRQAAAHAVVLLLPLAALPIAVAPEWAPRPDVPPVLPLVGLLLATAGLPFFVVSASAPLLQRWFAAAGGSRDPYFLYAASNTGSLTALLAYPALVEPFVPLRQQAWLWAAGYAVLLLLTFTCAVLLWRSDRLPEGEAGGRPAAPRPQDGASGGRPVLLRARWVVLALVPASLLLGVTNYLTTDVSPVPLLWVLPLALYLLSFIVAFARLPAALHRLLVFLSPLTLLAVALMGFGDRAGLAWSMGLHLLAFFVAATVCHGELARLRPPVSHLTEFYLWVSVGGVLGGLFNALVAPAVFHSVVEYQVGLVLAAVLSPALLPGARRPALRLLNRALPVLVAAAVAVLSWRTAPARGQLLYRERNFFGVLRVERGTEGRTHSFIHGNVRHGLQIRSPDPRQRRLPLVYYFPTGPIGQVFHAFRGPRARPRVAVVGLGVGSLAGYGEAGQEFTFFEIDPSVERIARDPRFFTYLSDAEARGARVRTVLGDARLSLEREGQARYGLLVVDAFTGDAIPTHLLTREALGLYLDRLEADGVLAFHITNDYLDLRTVLGDLARAMGLAALVQDDPGSEDEARRGKAPSVWVLLACHPGAFGDLAGSPRWQPLAGRPGARMWTDDYSNVLGVLRW
jgi:hypothetical protein